MSRNSYADSEEGLSHDRWYAVFNRSARSKKGQAALRRLRDALLALPTKRLIRGDLALDGEVCAIGALQAHSAVQAGLSWDEAIRALDHGTEAWDYDDTVRVARHFGFAAVMAGEIVMANDEDEIRINDDLPAEATYRERIASSYPTTPEERYTDMLAWVEGLIQPVALEEEAAS